jgi:multidrug efflux system membrane fusion protein
MAENVPTAAAASPAAPPKTAPAPPAPPPSPRPKESRAAAPDEKSGSKLAVWVVLVLVIIGAVAAYLIFAHKKTPSPKVPPPITVSVTNAVKGNIDESVPGLGTVTPIYTAMISPRVDGQLMRVNYTEGQMVTPDDLLAEIDPGPYAAIVTQAEGQLARDKALLEGATIDLDRFKAAYAKNVGTNVLHAIPKQQVDDQEALVHQDEGTVKVDEGTLANAKLQLAYCFIHAPFAGRVGLRLVDPGNIVHAANTNALVAVTQLQPITVVFGVDQKYLPSIQRQLRAGHTMSIEAYATDDLQKLATGTFLTMDNLIDTGTGNIRIKGQFENKDLELFPNQFVNVKLIIDTLSNVTLIPTVAVQRSPQGAFVYVTTNQVATVTNNHVETVVTNEIVKTNSIIPGITDGDITSVEGLNPGQVVVTDNYNKLGDGMPVNVRKPGGRGQKGAPPDGTKKDAKKPKGKDDES